LENSIQPVADLPPEARELVEKVGAQVSKLQDKAQKEAAAVRQRADQEIEELTERSRKKVEALFEKLVAELKPLQVAYAKEGQLDEALAIRDQIKQLKVDAGGAQPDPGNLVSFHSQVGKSFVFEVTGQTDGAVWGTDVYTSDSLLATAAVHAGQVQPGEKKVVRVTIVPPPPSFRGSTRNGVTSASYGGYPGAYRLGS
jgi:LCCL domain-containing protein